jgi:hypothetical protein
MEWLRWPGGGDSCGGDGSWIMVRLEREGKGLGVGWLQRGIGVLFIGLEAGRRVVAE